jgi:hypothetical protein
MGRNYTDAEWVAFYSDVPPEELPPALGRQGRKVRTLAVRAFHAWRIARAWTAEPEDVIYRLRLPQDARDMLAHKAYASIVGHGVGLWDGDFLKQIWPPGVSPEDQEALSDDLDDYMCNGGREEAHALRAAVRALDDAMSDLRGEE